MSSQGALDSPDSGTLLGGERKVLELIATGAPLATSLDTLCRVIDKQSGLRSSIFLLDSDGQRLRFAAGPHVPESWRSAVASFPVTETACGAAVTNRKQVVSPDIAGDPLYAGYHEAAAAAGLRAAWSTPFFSKEGSALGTFAVLGDVVGAPSADNLALVERATHLASIAVEWRQTETTLRESERLVRTVLDALPVGVGVEDHAGDIILTNPASRRIWGNVIRSGAERYARSKAWYHDTGKPLAADEWASVRARTTGEVSLDEVLDIEAFDGTRKVIQNSAVPIRDSTNSIVGSVFVNEDVSARTDAERERNDALDHLRSLTAKLMHAQDDERRRIAQMLHETTAQDLAGLKMLLARLKRTADALSEADRGLFDESVELAERAMTGIRTLSYLLHPPFLDEGGLLAAIRWYARGFSERSGIPVDLDLPASLDRLPQEIETAMFRITQETLINIHRHASSPTARIRLTVARDTLTLETADQGKGMEPALVSRLREGVTVGVGIAGMRERLKQLGGTLSIDSSRHGTVVRSTIPLPRETT